MIIFITAPSFPQVVMTVDCVYGTRGVTHVWVWPVNGMSNCYVILTTKSLSLPCDVVDMIWVWSVSKTIQVTQTYLPQEGMLLINMLVMFTGQQMLFLHYYLQEI